MAGHDDRDRVGGAGGAHGPDRSWVPGRGRDLGVALGPAVVDLGQVPEHLAPVAAGQLQVHRQLEDPAPPGEVLLQLPSRRIAGEASRAGCAGSPARRAPPAPGRGPPTRTRSGRTPADWPRRAGRRADSRRCGTPGRAGRSRSASSTSRRRSRSRSDGLFGRDRDSHRGVPFVEGRVVRSFLIPSAAARRAASACRRSARPSRRTGGRRGSGRPPPAAASPAGAATSAARSRSESSEPASAASGTSATGTGCRRRRRVTSIALRWAMVTNQARTFASGPQLRIGPQRGQEGLRPGVVGVDGTQHRSADAQYGGAVLRHHLLERLHAHIL